MLEYLADVLRYARFLCRNHADGDDLAQETFLRAFRARDSYELGSNGKQWLFTICRNCFLRERQRAQRVVAMSDEPELDGVASAMLHVSAKQGGYEDIFVRIDLAPAIERAVAQLPDGQRAAVALVDIEGLSYAEAAEALDVAIGTVRSRLFRGRRVLQEKLIEYAQDAGLVSRGPAEPRIAEGRVDT
ncbi:MAG: sigma-70 family RNA polymerase sigma factor [Longimicrobiales bacterium]